MLSYRYDPGYYFGKILTHISQIPNITPSKKIIANIRYVAGVVNVIILFLLNTVYYK